MIDRDWNHLYPAFREKLRVVVSELRDWCDVHTPEYLPALAEGFRTQERQIQLYGQGRDSAGKIVDRGHVVTYKNGTTNPSNHQSCLAADVAFVGNDGMTWDVPSAVWSYLQHLAHVHGLTSGSDWRMQDRPHLEWPTEDKATYAEAKSWKAAAGLK